MTRQLHQKRKQAAGTLARRIARTMRHYGKAHDAPAWSGPVVRLHELTDAERAEVGARPRAERLRSVYETWRCANPWCSQWTMHGAHLRRCCNFCNEPRPPCDPTRFGLPRPGEREMADFAGGLPVA